MNGYSDLADAGRIRREATAHSPRIGPDLAADGIASMRAVGVSTAAAIAGTDPHFEAAIHDLTALERMASGELQKVMGLEEAAKEGRFPGHKATELAQDAHDEAARRYAAVAQQAERALEAAREGVIGQLLPEPALDTATAMRRDELGRLLTAARVSSSPVAAFEAIYRDRAKSGDRSGLAVLLSGWGRATFLEAGGSDEGWAELRRGLALRAAEGPLKDSPAAGRLRKLHGTEANKALHAAKSNADAAVKRLKARDGR